MINNEILQQYLNTLADFVAFKSISTDKAFNKDTLGAAKFLYNFLTKIPDAKVKLIRDPNVNPVVFAFIPADINPDKTHTYLIYGHYDVQPASKEEWKADPFVMQIADYNRYQRVIGRGVADNKGQILIHLLAVYLLKKQQKLSKNIIFVIEGNEETGNPNLVDIVKPHLNDFNIDYAFISDGEIVKDYPTIEYSLRGGFNVKLTVTTANKTVHSGLYGGAIPNAAVTLVQMLNTIFESREVFTQIKPVSKMPFKLLNRFINFAQIFRYKRQHITKELLKLNKKVSKVAAKDALKDVGVKYQFSDFSGNFESFDFFTQTGLLPTIEITGIKTGYIGEGFSNIIPHTAEAKLNFRVAPGQDVKYIAKEFKNFIKLITPAWAKVDIEFEGIHEPVFIEIDKDIKDQLTKALKSAYGKEPLFKPVGGAIPFVTDLYTKLKIPVLLVPFANQDCNMHGINENFRIDLIEKGLEFALRWWG